MVTGGPALQLQWFDIEPADVAAADAWDDAHAESEQLVAEDAAFARWIAGAAAQRGLVAPHPELTARWHASDTDWPGLLELERTADHAERHVLVLAEQSSMDPRPVWPVRVPVLDLQAWDYDAVLWCYIPKRPALESGDRRALGRGVTCAGWAWADEVTHWKPVQLDPHPGQEFHAEIWQAQLTALRAPEQLVSSLFAHA